MKEAIVAVPTVNNLKYLKRVVETINCSFPYELIVVDNGSTDNTFNWLEEQGIKCIHHDKNFGVSYANNEVMDYAFSQGKLLFMVHNDVLLHKDCLNNLYWGLIKTDFDLLYGYELLSAQVRPELLEEFNYDFVVDYGGKTWRERQAETLTCENESDVRKIKAINFTVRAIKKSTFDKVGYFDVNYYPAYFEDNDYGLRCKLGGVKVGIITKAIFYHFWSRSIHEGGARALNAKYFEKNRAHYIQKWGGRIGHETITEPNIKLFRTREEDYELIKDKIV